MSDADMNYADNIDELKEEFWESMAASPFVMVGLMDQNAHSVPMTAQLDKDANSAIWFYTSRGNRLVKGGRAMMQFAAKGHDMFACISGTITEETNQAIIDKHWGNAVEAWYEKGRQDPDMIMLRMDLGTAEIWEADASLKGMFKMITGKTMDGDEMGQHAEVAL